MTRFSFLAALLLSLFLVASPARADGTLELILDRVWNGQGDWDDVKTEARYQADHDRPKSLSAPPTTPSYETFEGNWEAPTDNSKLAIFSDDGCDVTIDGVKIWSKRGVGQALPDLVHSLYPLPFTFQSGRNYYIKVDYSNTSYLGRADIDGVTLFVYSGAPKVWSATATEGGTTRGQIGWKHEDNGTWTENGRLTSPTLPATGPLKVLPGQRLTCEVEAATDYDYWSDGASHDWEADTVSYAWSADKGAFAVSDGNGGERMQSTDSVPKTTFVVPADAQDGDTITVKCKLDDASPQGDTRDDVAVERTITLQVLTYNIEFSGLARACAGGIAVDGVHSFTLTATAKLSDGSLAPENTEFKLVFENNRGHDYSNDDPSIKPANWTIEQIKQAKFVAPNQELVTELPVQTNANGQFSVTVLSSDIISSDIKVKAQWTPQGGTPREIGSKGCNFASAWSLRRFGLVNFPNEEDTGWIFNQDILLSDDVTPAKVYLTRLATYSKFAKNRILFSSKSRFEAVFGEFSPQSGVFIFKILNSTVNRA